MTPRRRRLFWVIGILAGVGIASALALRAFQQNVTFYFDPSKIAAGQVHPGQSFRLGGMVEKGSVVRTPGTLDVRFVVTDFKHSVPVRYSKVLPDLFREGAGVVAHGRLRVVEREVRTTKIPLFPKLPNATGGVALSVGAASRPSSAVPGTRRRAPVASYPTVPEPYGRSSRVAIVARKSL